MGINLRRFQSHPPYYPLRHHPAHCRPVRDDESMIDLLCAQFGVDSGELLREVVEIFLRHPPVGRSVVELDAMKVPADRVFVNLPDFVHLIVSHEPNLVQHRRRRCFDHSAQEVLGIAGEVAINVQHHRAHFEWEEVERVVDELQQEKDSVQNFVEVEAVRRLHHVFDGWEEEVTLPDQLADVVVLQKLQRNFCADGMRNQVDLHIVRNEFVDEVSLVPHLALQVVQIFVAFEGRCDHLQFFLWLVMT